MQDVFVGMGHNPDGPDIPVGFGMLLEGDPVAKAKFGELTSSEKSDLIYYMQQAKTGQDSEYRVMNAVQKLKENQVFQLLSSGKHADKFF